MRRAPGEKQSKYSGGPFAQLFQTTKTAKTAKTAEADEENVAAAVET